jgi:hypothetical protein
MNLPDRSGQHRVWTKAHRILVLLLIPLLMGLGIREASALRFRGETDVFGGAGGAGYSGQRITCPPGSFLTALAAKTGGWMAHIRIYCAIARPDGRWAGEQFPGPLPGMGWSSKGRWTTGSCPRDWYIYAIHSVQTYIENARDAFDEGDPRQTFISGATFDCVWRGGDIGGSRFTLKALGRLTRDDHKYRHDVRGSKECIDLATGLKGTAGEYVSSLGLTCAPFTPQPPQECAACHQNSSLSSLRLPVQLSAPAILLTILMAAGWGFVRFSPEPAAFPGVRRFNQRFLVGLVATSAVIAVWIRASLLDSVHAPLWPIAAALVVLTTAIIALALATVIRTVMVRYASRHKV